MLETAVQRDRSEVRDAKNNERHVCGRRRGGEPAVLDGEAYIFQALFPWGYVDGLNDARTKLGEGASGAQGLGG